MTPRTAQVPVLVLTAKADPGEEETVPGLGARRFLTKPFDPMDLVADSRELLEAGRAPDSEPAT